MTVTGIVPDVERVAVYWLANLGSVAATGLVGGAATTLPPTDANGQWNGAPVFLLVNGSPGGIANKVAPLRSNMVRVEALAGRGKLAQVGSVCEIIHDATYTMEGCGTFVPAKNNLSVTLRDVSIFQTPRQVRGDPATLARSTMVLAFTYHIGG